MSLLTANSDTHRLRPFPAVTHHRLHESSSGSGSGSDDAAQCRPAAPFGQPLPGGRLAWAANGASLEVVCCRTGARRAAWTFGRHRPEAPPPQITAVCALSELAGPAGDRLLAVTLDCSAAGGGGMLCLFNVASGAVVRAVQLAHPATALTVLAAPQSPDVSAPLRQMGALAAVGTQEGYVLLLDLCLDVELATDEGQPGQATYVSPVEPAAERRRAEQAAAGNHLCVPLNDAAVEAGAFLHRSVHGELNHAHPAHETWVSALHFVPHLRSLVVGLSFGCFQVWNLETLQLEFASRYEPGVLPVVGCVFLEPENDPRRFVYLWVVHSVPSFQGMSGVASAALYSLLYGDREWSQPGLAVYRGLQQVSLRLVYDLTTTPERPEPQRVSASCALSAVAVPPVQDQDDPSGDDSLLDRDATCAAVAWEAWSQDAAVAATWLAVFDLNKWYQAHMPAAVDAGALERCDYLRFYSLDVSTGIVMGVAVSAPQKLSGVLSVGALLDVGVVSLTFSGLRERLLRGLESDAGAQLSRPQQAYEVARRAGLVAPTAVTAAEQREALLTLALESGFSTVLTACATGWSSGDTDTAGCSLRALLDWLWRRAVEVTAQVDAACVRLFDYSGEGPLPEEETAALHALRAQLDSLCSVLRVMTTRTANTEMGLGELESQSYVLRVRSLHVSVILWLCHACLLPESGDDGAEFGYPGGALAEWYRERRRAPGGRFLMIDGLVEEVGERLSEVWREEGGDGAYPPRSLQALTRTYLLDGVPDYCKHRITHYLLMDLTRMLSDDATDWLKSFPSSFAMSPSVIKLTHAFWHLDHGNVESALVFLLDPLVQPSDLAGWQHRRVLEALLARGEARAALRYVRARQPPVLELADVQLHLRALLGSGLVGEALQLERRHRPLAGEQLTAALLDGCQQRQLLKQLMRLPMDPPVEKLFVEFMLNNEEKDCQELLHVFYLQRGQYREAAALHRRLAAAGPSAHPERAEFRDSLHLLLPRLIRQSYSGEGGPLRRPVVQPGLAAAARLPLSARLLQVQGSVRSRSVLIQTQLEQSGKSAAAPVPAVTPFRTRRERKRAADEDAGAGTPRLPAQRALRPEIRRLLQTPPVPRRRARPPELPETPGTPRLPPPSAQMTPQSILRVNRFLESSGTGRTEETPSKQLRFGLLRGRRSLEESRDSRAGGEDATPPQPFQVKPLFTPGKTPRAPEPRRERPLASGPTMADFWAATRRSPSPEPEPVSPPRARLSLASEADDSIFYSFEASPTLDTNTTVEIFDCERRLRLREWNWSDSSGRAAAAVGGSEPAPDASVTAQGGPAEAEEERQTMRRELRASVVGKDKDESMESVDQEEMHRNGDEDNNAGDAPGVRSSTPERGHAEMPSPHLGDGLSMMVSPLSDPNLLSPREVLEQARQSASSSLLAARSAISRSRAATEQKEHVILGKERRDSAGREQTGEERRGGGACRAPVGVTGEGRQPSGSSEEFSPLISNSFDTMAAYTEAESTQERRLAAVEAQVLMDSGFKKASSASPPSASPSPSQNRTSAGDKTRQRNLPCPAEGTEGFTPARSSPRVEPVIVAETAWTTGQTGVGHQAEAVLLVTGQAGATDKPPASEVEAASRPDQTPVMEPPFTRETAWVTGEKLALPVEAEEPSVETRRAGEGLEVPSVLSDAGLLAPADSQLVLHMESDSDGDASPPPASRSSARESRASGTTARLTRSPLRRRRSPPTSVSPRSSPSAVSTGPSLTSISLRPTRTSVSPRPSRASVSPRPSRTSVSPRPSSTSVSPGLSLTSASPRLPSAAAAPPPEISSPPRTAPGASVRSQSPAVAPRAGSPLLTPRRSLRHRASAAGLRESSLSATPSVSERTSASSVTMETTNRKESSRSATPSAPGRTSASFVTMETTTRKESSRSVTPSAPDRTSASFVTMETTTRKETSRSATPSAPDRTSASFVIMETTTKEESSPSTKAAVPDMTLASPVTMETTAKEEETTLSTMVTVPDITSASSITMESTTKEESSRSTKTAVPDITLTSYVTMETTAREEETTLCTMVTVPDMTSVSATTMETTARDEHSVRTSAMSPADIDTPRRVSDVSSVGPAQAKAPPDAWHAANIGDGPVSEITTIVKEQSSTITNEEVTGSTPATGTSSPSAAQAPSPLRRSPRVAQSPKKLTPTKDGGAAAVSSEEEPETGPRETVSPTEKVDDPTVETVRSPAQNIQPPDSPSKHGMEKMSPMTADIQEPEAPLHGTSYDLLKASAKTSVEPIPISPQKTVEHGPSSPSEKVKKSAEQISAAPQKTQDRVVSSPETNKDSEQASAAEAALPWPVIPAPVTPSRRRLAVTPERSRTRLSMHAAAFTTLSPVVESPAAENTPPRLSPARALSPARTRGSSAEPTGSVRKRVRTPAAASEPEAGVSGRTRASSVESETSPRRSSRLRLGSQEPEQPTPAGTRKKMMASEAQEEPEAPSTGTRRRLRSASQEPEQPTPASTRKKVMTSEAQEEPEAPSTGTRRRLRSASQEPEQPTPASTRKNLKSLESQEEAKTPRRRLKSASQEPELVTVKASPVKTREEVEKTADHSQLESTRKRGRPKKTPDTSQVDVSGVAAMPESTKKRGKSRKVSEPTEALVLDAVDTVTLKRTRKASEEPEEPPSHRSRAASGEPSDSSVSRSSRRKRNTSQEPDVLKSTETPRKTRARKGSEESSLTASPARSTRSSQASQERSEPESPVPSTRKRTRKASQGSETTDSPERSAKTRRSWQDPADDDATDDEAIFVRPRSTRARSVSLQPSSPVVVRTRASSEQPAADDASDSDGHSPKLVRRSRTSARLSQLPAIPEVEEPAAAAAAAGRRRGTRRRRMPVPDPLAASLDDVASPVRLVSEQQLAELRAAIEQDPPPRRRSSAARARSRVGGKRMFVKLW